MKLKLALHRSGAADVDLAVTADAITTVGDLADYLLRCDPAASPHRGDTDELTLGVHTVAQQVRALDPRLTLAESGLVSGATVSISRAGHAYHDPDAAAVAVVGVLAGPDAGCEFPIAGGTSIVGRERGCEVRLTDPLVSRQHARITVTDVVEIVDLGSSNGLQVGAGVVQRVRLQPGDTVVIGDTRLTVRLLGAVRPGGASAVGFVRSPRLDPVWAGESFTAPEPPEAVKIQRFPALTVLVSLLLGAVLFAVTRSLYALTFVALSPLLVLATALESRMEARAGFRGAVAQFRADLADLVADAEAAAQQEVLARDREHPSTAQCVTAVRTGNPVQWCRRPGEHGFGELRLGTGRLPARNTIKVEGGAHAPRYLQKELAARIAPFATVDPVPVVAAPLRHGAVGLAGDRARVLGAARALLVQLAALHSPAEVVIGAVASARTAADWDWLKWLPHTSSGHSPLPVRLLASDAAAAAGLLGELEDLVERRTSAGPAHDESAGPPLPVVVVLVEHDAPADHARLVQLAESGWRHGVSVLWLAADTGHLPAACRTFVDVGTGGADSSAGADGPGPGGAGADGTAGAAGFVYSAERVMPLTVEQLDEPTCAELARLLAPMVDLGARLADESDLPRSVPLLAVIGSDVAGSEVAGAAEGVIERWRENSSIVTGPFAPADGVHRAGTLRAVVGQAAGQAHALDLRTDGPHALVGGTTGAGKSELLQSWILAMALAHSPQRLSFLLVDYKGGSAFRDCVDLPHTIGLVTDLTPHLVRRALTSLAAELRYREQVLARYAAKDLATLEQLGVADAPPSLVIVVDEFAALVGDVPEFVDGVVDVAQRGRSLGLHLILATQRPAGVIKDNLRANTNLRLALRVADEDDSSDVLGSPDAAYFDPAVPGRAISKTGPGRLIPFQAAYAGGRTADRPPQPELHVEELVVGTGRAWEPPAPARAVAPETGPTDIRRLVDSIGRAGAIAQLPPLRKPWLPELRSCYDLADRALVASRRTDDELVFGIRDDPENQAQPPTAFVPDRDGNLAVYGTGGAGKSTLLRTLAIAAGFTVRGGPCHVYALDFGARGLSMLEELPHVGSVIAGTDHERVARLIDQLRALVDERAARYSAASAGTITQYRRLAGAPDEPRILLLVDGIAAFRHAYEPLDRSRWFDTFLGIATDGRPVGVHVVLSCEQRTALPAALASSVQRRVVLRMAAADDYAMLDVPGGVLDADSPPGRGLVRDAEVQVAVLGGSPDVQVQAQAVRSFAESMRRAGRTAAAPVRRLPETVALDDLPAAVHGAPVIGLSGSTLGPVAMPLHGSFLVAGPRGSGRTTALHTLAVALRRAAPDTALYYLGQRRSPLAGLGVWTRRAAGPVEVADAAEELAAEIGARAAGLAPGTVAVFVEDVGAFVDSPADLALQDLARVLLAEEQLLVVDGETSALASSFGLLGYAKSSRSGLALQPGDGDGQTLFRTNFPRPGRGELPPGRGFAVRLGRPELIQVAQAGAG